MAQFFTDFEEYTLNQKPSDWTLRWAASTGDYEVQDFSGEKALTNTMDSGRRAISWDEAGSFDNAEILIRGLNGHIGSGNSLRTVLRGSALGGETGYLTEVRAASDDFRIVKYSSGSFSVLATLSFVSSSNDLLWSRFRIDGNELKAKVWRDGDTEPESWGLEITDNDSNINSGWAGVGQFSASNQRWFKVGIGTDGDTAPLEAPEEGITLNAESGSYSIAGKNADLLLSRLLLSEKGTYTVNGKQSDLLKGSNLNSQKGTYSLSGKSADLLQSRIVTAQKGSYLIDGKPADLIYTEVGQFLLSAEKGVYSLQGKQADLLYTGLTNFNLTAEKGSYSIQGKATDLIKDYILSLDKGSYVATGKDTELYRGFNLSATKGEYQLTGKQVGFLREYIASLQKGNLTIGGKDASLFIASIGFADSVSITAKPVYDITLSEETIYTVSVTANSVYIISTSANPIIKQNGNI